MNKVISLIACISIAVFAQNEQEQYSPPQQAVPPPQYQQQQAYPPQQQQPQQGQYQYPPQGQYQQYPPPQQAAPPPQYQQQQAYPPPQQAYPPQQQEPNKEQVKNESVKAMKFGDRAGFVMNSFSTGNSKKDEKINMGMGIGVGGVASYPVTDIITFNPEAVFFYRTLYNVSESDDDYSFEESVSEFAISIPLMFQVMPIVGTPVHFAGGLQIDLPFSSETKWEENDDGQKDSGSKDFKKRATLDFGIALGAGYRVMPNMSVDLRIVIGLTSLSSEDKDESSLNQYGLGVSYFF